ncbi:Coiled-coil domain-containing protein, partial [Armadillidium vulgare]
MNSQKLNFIDELENLRNENIALKRAVESKSAAIGILRNELQECQKERDEFRNVAENHPVISQPLPNLKTIPTCPERTSAILGGSENTLAQLLSQSKEENKALRLEISDLKCRLYDAQSDLKILRGEKSRKADSHQCRLSIASTSQLAQQERESLIQQLEELSSKCQIQETDLRCLLEEREELVKERDEIRHKWHRLNHVLNKILVPSFSLTENSDKVKLRKNRRIVDLDAIIAENRYLQQRLKQVLEEKALVVSNASKYKTALERGRVRPNSNSNNKLGFTDTLIMSPKQVAEFLKEHNIDSQMGEGGNPTSKDMKLLCVALLDSLNQKSRFIKTQKAANKMLIERVTNLERQVLIQSDDENHKATPATSTMMPTEINLLSASLMDGYNPSITTNDINSENVDQMLNAIQKEIDDDEEGNTNSEEDEIEGRERIEKCIDNVDFNKDIDIIDNESNIDDKSDSEEIVPLENLDKYI